MNTHPDILWELVRDRQARLREEAEVQNRNRQALARRKAGRHVATGGPWHRAFIRSTQSAPAGTLAACAPGGAD